MSVAKWEPGESHFSLKSFVFKANLLLFLIAAVWVLIAYVEEKGSLFFGFRAERHLRHSFNINIY